MLRFCAALLLAQFAGGTLSAEVRPNTGAGALKQQLERLRVVGSVMMIAAHPDDENTALLAYAAQGRKLRTAYLSLTRGEGGQNLIGPEQGDMLGVIRTQELLSARGVDGAEQYFTRAIDFGFSKTPEETLEKWGRQEILADIVWMIRQFRPDVIFLRFSGTPRDGHGQHQASALLGREAFRLAADPKAFPEQLKFVQPWQAKRLLWNAFSFTREQEQEMQKAQNRLAVDLGEFNPVLGLSYGELAGLSRSQHRSQGMGSPERRGTAPNYFILYEGEPAQNDFMDGIDISWRRLPGGAAVQTELDAALAALSEDTPEKVIPPLLKARKLIAAIPGQEARRKLAELDEAVAMAAGLWLEVDSAAGEVAPGGALPLTLNVVNRGNATVELTGVDLEGIAGAQPFTGAALTRNAPYSQKASATVPENQPLSQPLQLRCSKQGSRYGISELSEIGPAEGPALLTVRFRLMVDGSPIEISKPVKHRYVDRVRGELTQPVQVVPPVSLGLAESSMLFPDAKPRKVKVEVQAHRANAAGTVSLTLPQGWKCQPQQREFALKDSGQMAMVEFTVTPPDGASAGELSAAASIGGRQVNSAMLRLNYEHIPRQAVFPEAKSRVVREDVKTLARRVGYVTGAGDAVPEALQQLGVEVTLLNADDLTRGDLSRFDAIVTGVRAWSVREDLRTNRQRLIDYMNNGGTVVAQYETLDRFNPDSSSNLKTLGPYPLEIGFRRVTVEDAPVKILKPGHPLLERPNPITQRDFDGWIQERGLYFPSKWDDKYEALLETHDPGEETLQGGLLYAPVGKGSFIFTSYSWFRELPAGVPGAYKLFANLISAGK